LATHATADPFKPSMQDQVKLGQQAAQELRTKKDVKVLPASDARVKAFRRVAANLMAHIPAKELKERPFQYSFDIIDSKEVNAFALPGGPVFFYTGLLDKLSTEDQVAGVLGHELTHIRNEHWAKQYADETKRGLGLSILLYALKANRTIGQITNVLNTVAFGLRYSRDHESEADQVGFELMVSSGYNPQGIVDVMRVLAKQGSGGPEWLNSHPDSNRRADTMQARIKAMPNAQFPAQRPWLATRAVAERNVQWDANGWATVVR
jgi:predicted Zn-dependent protease